ncbi:hypothetical protein TTHERM_000370939 (macronuclear) [Tetrahymena thermophila SB210]|uniref:Uncharacterized protein n=1 Tax=Tetrahymena thermophila (strain SB210) TaxID=312017 RepID=W7X9E2_TETTS|nr:hypothetical protein TTHERM_000370939 [Tetrahymena thermophila SB210]EWS76020.1 hypothetical protein TTHERM_000370939 [Tetrahymena thermophila SB210]|eukprot:XP_012651458.1 hypothetical protein TTHERM_000370939 [Tetrahymena thermophila SB210]
MFRNALCLKIFNIILSYSYLQFIIFKEEQLQLLSIYAFKKNIDDGIWYKDVVSLTKILLISYSQNQKTISIIIQQQMENKIIQLQRAKINTSSFYKSKYNLKIRNLINIEVQIIQLEYIQRTHFNYSSFDKNSMWTQLTNVLQEEKFCQKVVFFQCLYKFQIILVFLFQNTFIFIIKQIDINPLVYLKQLKLRQILIPRVQLRTKCMWKQKLSKIIKFQFIIHDKLFSIQSKLKLKNYQSLLQKTSSTYQFNIYFLVGFSTKIIDIIQFFQKSPKAQQLKNKQQKKKSSCYQINENLEDRSVFLTVLIQNRKELNQEKNHFRSYFVYFRNNHHHRLLYLSPISVFKQSI